MKKMIDFGRNLPLDRLQYRELKDISIITSASADKPFHHSASLYAQDSCEIEKILPYSEIKFNSVQAASNSYWREMLDIIDIKDTLPFESSTDDAPDLSCVAYLPFNPFR